MRTRTVRLLGLVVSVCALAANCGRAWAIETAIPAVGGDVSRALLGDGTGVVIGFVDSGIDKNHPALAGNDSQGNPRLVAEANFVPVNPPNEPAGNTGDDRNGHGTFISSVALSSDPLYTGVAPDARYVNARVLDYLAKYSTDAWVRNGMIFALNQGADVLNMAINYDSASNPPANGSSTLDLMVDWAARELGVSCAICAGNISQATGMTQQVRAPASAFNGVTVGRTTLNFSQVHSDSATAPTTDGRMKPDLVAPGTGFTVARHTWEGAAADWVTLPATTGGCSLATPIVAGLMAQQIDAGRRLGLSTDPLVVKATLMNSAVKVPDKSNNAWQPYAASQLGDVYTVTRPLDDHSGAGQVDGAALAAQYLAGEFGPGLVDPVGWDLGGVGVGQFVDYEIDPNLMFGTTLTATLAWNRHVGRIDNGNGVIDIADTFSVLQPLSNLDLQIFRNGDLVAQSVSTVDNLEHLRIAVDTTAQYTLRVLGSNVSGAMETFALAWHGVAVPEPANLTLAVVVVGLWAWRWRGR